MSAIKRAIERGTVGSSWSRHYPDHRVGVIDPTQWAIADWGVLTGSGYTEIVATFRTKAEAESARRRLRRNRGIWFNSRLILLKRGEDGRWMNA